MRTLPFLSASRPSIKSETKRQKRALRLVAQRTISKGPLKLVFVVSQQCNKMELFLFAYLLQIYADNVSRNTV